MWIKIKKVFIIKRKRKYKIVRIKFKNLLQNGRKRKEKLLWNPLNNNKKFMKKEKKKD